MKTNQKVAVVALLLAAVAALCRVASLGKEIYVASFFGAGSEVDAYSLAILIPSLGAALFLGAIRRAFLAQYPAYSDSSSPSRETFTNIFLTNLLGASVLLAGLLSLFIRPLLTAVVPGRNAEVLEGLLRVSLAAVWIIVPMSLVVGFTAALNARGRFSAPQFTHLLPPLCTCILVYFHGRDWGARALILGLLLGTCAQAFVLLLVLAGTGHRLRLRVGGHAPALRALWALGLPIVFLEVLVQANVYVDRAMASLLPQGKVSVLYWSAMMKDFVSGTLLASLLTVLLPHFAEQVAEGDEEKVRHSCSLVIRYGALVLFPVSVLLAVCGPPVFRHLQMGRFDTAASTSVAACLAAYGIGLYGEFAAASLFQALTALQRVRAMLLLGLFTGFVPNIIFNLLLIRPLGEVGLALSTSLVVYTALIANYLTLRAMIGMNDEKRNALAVGGFFLAASLMALTALVVIWGARQCIGPSRSADLGGALAGGLIGLGLYSFLVLVFPGSSDARTAWNLLRGELSRRFRNS